MAIHIFISSVQKEFAEERKMLAAYIRQDELLGKFFQVFLFEESPAQSGSAQQLYLEQAQRCDIYLGLFGREYGNCDSAGVSATEREYDKAEKFYKYRIILIKNIADPERDGREAKLIKKAESSIVRKTFEDMAELRTAVYAALIRYLEFKEIIRLLPFDASKDTNAAIPDLDEDKIQDFIETARRKRNFPLTKDTSPEKLLIHLDLIDDDGRLKNAALLLFGKKPQKYFITSEVKCIQFFGNKVERPLPAYQIYKGDVFELVDKATDFVMGRLNNWTGVRDKGPTASVETHPEIPIEVVKEAIVNAVCHRDYRSNASVQVMLFRDRLEVRNPGALPFGLTIAKLYEDHKSIPANPLLAEPMYYKGYIEKAGTGTFDMVEKCRAYGLAEPKFRQDEDFRVIIFRPEGASEQAGTKPGTKLSSNAQAGAQVSAQASAQVRKILELCKQPAALSQIGEVLSMSNRGYIKRKFLAPLLETGLLVMTVPAKPTSPQQKYQSTERGILLIAQNNEVQNEK